MTTVKIKFRPSTVSTKEGCICYRVIHKRTSKQITSAHKLFPSEWDTTRAEIIMPRHDESRKAYLSEINGRIKKDLQRLEKIIKKLEARDADYTTAKIVALYHRPANKNGFISYARTLIERLLKVGKTCTAETYTTTVNSFARFHDKGDIPLDEVDADLMTEYESYLRKGNICANSSSYYMRNLRAIYNRAVEEGLCDQQHPFRRVYTGIAKTIKRAIPLKEIRRIKEMDLSGEPDLDYARTMFMMSFYTRGMSIIDMAYLKKTDLAGGVLSYRRKKTGQQLFIKWEKPMQEIINKYDTGNSPYLLPIIRGDASGDTARKQYRNKAHFINSKLKRIGTRIGLPIPLTLYVARHCWASVARSKNIPLSVISEGMGHDSEKTTLIYLASLDTTAVDRANNIIIKSL